MKELTSIKLYSIMCSSEGVKVFAIIVEKTYKELKNSDTQIL